jgi:ABC-2 type transport system permease protein
MSVIVATPPRRRQWGALRELVVTEFKQAWRAPLGLGLGVLVPVIILVILGIAPALQKNVPSTSTTYMTEYVPILIGLVLVLIALVSLPIPLVMLRERAFLRRLSTTPVAPRWLLTAQVLVNLVLALVAMVLIVGGGILFFHVAAPGQLGGFILSALLATCALFSLGLVIAALAPNPGVAGVAGTVLLYPLLFFAGMWTPRETMSDLMRTISDYTPLGAAQHAMLTSMQGTFPPTQSLVVMAAYAVVFGFLAVKLFRWE